MTEDAISSVLVLGDTQSTGWLERILLRRKRNDIERRRLIAQAAAEEFGLVVHLGDAIYDGGSPRHWSAFDRFMQPLFDRSPVLLVPGNHEYWRGETGLHRHAAPRFPNLRPTTWSAHVHGRIAFVLVDTNRRMLGKNWEIQQHWYGKTIAALERDGGVRHIVVCAHHPPFTNSRISGDARHVQAAFLDAVFASTKAKLFLSGHAHGYERFEKDGKCFIVSGGGGGPRVRYRHGRQSRHRDVTCPSGNGTKRPFNYLLLGLRGGGGLGVTVKGFDGNAPFAILDQIEL